MVSRLRGRISSWSRGNAFLPYHRASACLPEQIYLVLNPRRLPVLRWSMRKSTQLPSRKSSDGMPVAFLTWYARSDFDLSGSHVLEKTKWGAMSPYSRPAANVPFS